MKNSKVSKIKWTEKEMLNHIKINTKDAYSSIVVLAALYKKLYGCLPKGIGLSGFQAEAADEICDYFPNVRDV